MKILLDHCMPRPFERLLTGHEVMHTSRLGWGQLQNGKLLAAAEAAGFPVMVTVDRNMQFQQNMTGRSIAILYLRTPSNDMPTLLPMAQLVAAQLDQLQAGTVLTLNHPDMR